MNWLHHISLWACLLTDTKKPSPQWAVPSLGAGDWVVEEHDPVSKSVSEPRGSCWFLPSGPCLEFRPSLPSVMDYNLEV